MLETKDNKITNQEEASLLMQNELQESIKSRMLSDVPVGALASGGLDSSYLIGSLGKKNYESLTSYCAGNFTDALDESPYAIELINYINEEYDKNYKLKVIKKI